MSSIKEDLKQLNLQEMSHDFGMPIQEINSLLKKDDNSFSKLEKVGLFYYLKYKRSLEEYKSLHEKLM